MIDRRDLLRVADAAVDCVVPRLVANRGGRDLTVDTKSSSTDMVTDMDRWAEDEIVAHVRSVRPTDGFLGEEGSPEDGTSGVRWLIDPIDGTTNYLYDIPGSSVSVAAAVDGQVVAAVVHDLVRDERFRATLGGGATLDHTRITISGNTALASALVATGFSYDADRRRRQALVLVEVLPRVRDIRRLGGAAVDLCSVACGRVDAYYEKGLQPWDHAAGALIAHEAGARVEIPGRGVILAATPSIFDDLADLLRSAGADEA